MTIAGVDLFARAVSENVARVIVGKDEPVTLAIVALLCGGHVLLEDVPGVGKTMMARAVALSLGCSFKRLQCTPDLLPNDVTGVSVFNQKTQDFEFRAGPAFVNILLADEVNRATPRTQSALLEAMGEHQVTVDGVTRPLPQPFMVLATQNPIEYEGTFPLPEAQLDRFLLRVEMGYPTQTEEEQILVNLRREHPIDVIGQVVDPAQIAELQRAIWEVHVDETVRAYIVRLVQGTRQHPDLALSVSPRGSLGLYKAGQALAAIRGRDYVLPDDVKYLAPFVLCHRVIVKAESALRNRTAHDIIARLVETTALDVGELEQAR
jgi:MoxR-like ATPase